MATKKETETKKKMVTYVATELFKDTDGVIYNKGDKYPQAKSKPTEARIKALSTEGNKYKRPFIKEA